MSRSNVDDAALNGTRQFATRYASLEATLTGDYIILPTSPIKLVFDGGISDRTIRLPAVTPDGGQEYWIFNSGTTNVLNIVDDGGVAVDTILVGISKVYSSLPSGLWRVWGFDPTTVTLTFPTDLLTGGNGDLSVSRTWTLTPHAQNTFFAGPTVGADAVPTFRLIVAGDLPASVPLSVVNDTNVTGSIAAQTLTLGFTGTLAPTRGGTGIGTYTLGDTLYSSATDTLAKLAGNITTTRKFLRQTGNGAVSAAPAWDTIVAADVPASALTKVDDTNVTLTLGGTPASALLAAASITAGWTGTLAVARGGTGGGAASGTLLDNITGFAATGILVRTAAGTYAFRTATGTANEITVSNGDGVAGNPTFSLPAALTFTGKTVTGGTFSGITLSGTIAGTPTFSGANFITLGNIAQVAANTLLGNSTGSAASATAFTITSLTNKATPTGTDEIPIWDGAAGAMKKAALSSLPSSSSGSANGIRNGSMNVWQKGVSALAVAATTVFSYVTDGHMIAGTYSAGAGPTVDRATNSRTNALTWYGLKVTGATNATVVKYKHRIESFDAVRYAGRQVIIQAQIRNDTGGSITPQISTNTANAQDNFSAVTADLAATNVQACGNTAWTQIAYSYSVAAGANNGLEIILDFGSNFSANTKSIIIAELSIDLAPSGTSTGTVASPPTPTFPTIADDLLINRRFYATSYEHGTAPGTATNLGLVWCAAEILGSWAASSGVLFPTEMRAAPSVSYWDGAGTASKVSTTTSTAASSTFTAGATLQTAPFNISKRGFAAQGPNSSTSSWIHYAAVAEL